MNCGCIKRLEGEIAKAPFVTAKAGENIEVTCAATGFRLTDDNSMELILSVPFRVRGTAKGFTSEKGKEFPVAASFCPFCGVPAKADAAPKANAHDQLVAALRAALRELGDYGRPNVRADIRAALVAAGAAQ